MYLEGPYLHPKRVQSTKARPTHTVSYHDSAWHITVVYLLVTEGLPRTKNYHKSCALIHFHRFVVETVNTFNYF